MADPIKVLFLNHVATLGGGEIALLNLLKAIDRRRIDPQVLLFSDGPLATRLRDAGVPCEVLKLSPDVIDLRKDTLGTFALRKAGAVTASAGFVARLVGYFRRLRPQLIYANSLKSDVLGGLAARSAGIPCIWHVRDRIADDYLPASVASAFRKGCRIVPNAVVVNSSATAATLEGKVSGRLHVVRDGTPWADDPPAIRPARVPIQSVGIVGRIAPWKGQDVFIRAAAKVAEQHPQVTFRVVGDAMFGETEYRDHCHQLARSLGMADRMQFRGFQSDVLREFESLDLVIHASTLPEPFGQVLIEAMAMGRPVIASDAGAVPEILSGDRYGVRVCPGDADALADAICGLMGDPDRAANLAIQGRERVQSEFTIRRTADGVCDAIERYCHPAWPQSVASIA